MPVWLTALHVVSVFLAFALNTGVGLLLSGVAHSRDVRAIRSADGAARPLFIAGSVTLLLGIVFGFGTASTAGYGLGATWLIVAYVLVAILLAITGGIHAPWSARLARAAAASPVDQPSAELLAIIDDRIEALAGPVGLAVWLALVVVMVVKPG
jgi:uncharacterized membrane protein